VSFEWDLDPLTLAAKHAGCFPHLRHGAPLKILQNGNWKHDSNLLRWELLKGDFRDFLDSADLPDLIYYDPFSYKTDSDLWTAEVFSRIFTRCLPKSAELYTYSASTAVRAALLQTGFFVAQGVGTGPKSDTTIAFTSAKGAADHPLAPQLLGQEWLKRWRRSAAKFPENLSGEEKTRFETLIETHRQFSTDF
jgi:queuine tRNA-ribosyltransferase